MEGRPTDDSVLIARAVRGDSAAYEEIVQRYQQVAFRTAYVIAGSAADAPVCRPLSESARLAAPALS